MTMRMRGLDDDDDEEEEYVEEDHMVRVLSAPVRCDAKKKKVKMCRLRFSGEKMGAALGLFVMCDHRAIFG